MRAPGKAPAIDFEPAVSSGQALLSRLRSLFSRSAPTAPEAEAPGGRSAYLPGLDGLRALAVIGVLVYHARPQWLPGGFLGVELFFVISGFIITRALLDEWQAHGRIALGSFWLRRARRLLPAIGLLLAGVLAYAAAFEPGEVARLRGDILAALAYVTNWHLVLGDQSYFEAFQRPSMLRHLWSLAIEEQFYILWPLVLTFGLPILKRRGLVVLIVAGIAASTIAMALMYDPAGDNARAYFGTDTRAAGLLIGALLAFAIAARPAVLALGSRPAVAVGGFVALAGLAVAALWLDEGKAFLYQGGFLTVGLISAALIAAACAPNAFSRLLAVRPLRWVGVRSYGIYLWHWPVYMLAWPREASYAELAVQIIAVLVLAAASYSLLEQPVRRGAIGRTWRRVRAWPAQSLRYRSALVFSGAGTASVVLSLLVVAVLAKPPEAPPYFSAGNIRLQSIVVAQDVGSFVRPSPMGRVQNTISALTTEERNCPWENLPPGGALLGLARAAFESSCPQPPALFDPPEPAEGPPATAQAPDVSAAAGLGDAGEIDWIPAPEVDELQGGDAAEPVTAIEAPAAPSPEPTTAAGPTPVASPEPQVQAAQPPATPNTVLQAPPSVTAIGDSVMLGAAYTLAASIPGIDLDALVGRQADAAIGLLQQKAAAGVLGQVVVMQIGNNGTFNPQQFDQVMAVIGPERTAVFINLNVPRAWEDSNNAVIAAGVSRYTNATLVDWSTACATYQGLTIADGIHLTPTGASYYTQLVIAAIDGG